MRPMRGLFVLAVVAALWGAPSSVSAAVNDLSSPQASPASGSVTTVFTFRVRYDGGFPAVTVRVTVAGLSVPTRLESGTLTAGWWSGSTLLPTGAWSTSFRSTSAQGPSSTIAGPAVIVEGLADPPPSSSASARSSSGPTPQSAPVGDPGGPTAPPAAPAPSPQEVAATATAVASPNPGAPGPDATPVSSHRAEAPSPGGSASTPVPGDGGGTAPSGGGAGDHAPAEQDAPPSSAPSTPAPGGDHALAQPAPDAGAAPGGRAPIDDMVSAVLLIGLAGIASVAIVGTLLLVAGRRRRSPEHVPVTAGTGAAPSAAEEAAMRQKARTSRDRAAGDPIVAALGIDDEMAARRAIRRSLREPAARVKPPARGPRTD